MTSMQGADVDALDQLGRKFDEESQKIKQASTEVNAQLTNAWWKGPDADRFRNEWSSTHQVSLNRLAEALQQAAAQVRKEAQEQRAASGG